MAARDITQADLHRLLDYDASTGVLTWRERTPAEFTDARHSAEHQCAKWNSAWAGKQAGTILPTGYRGINLIGSRGYAHRLAWMYVHGEWPLVIDHINGDRDDNRIANLRSVTHRINHKNQARRTINTSGVVGVSWLTKRKRWQARIMVDGLQINLGLYAAKADAIAARMRAERVHGFHENHGKRSSTYTAT